MRCGATSQRGTGHVYQPAGLSLVLHPLTEIRLSKTAHHSTALTTAGFCATKEPIHQHNTAHDLLRTVLPNPVSMICWWNVNCSAVTSCHYAEKLLSKLTWRNWCWQSLTKNHTDKQKKIGCFCIYWEHDKARGADSLALLLNTKKEKAVA